MSGVELLDPRDTRRIAEVADLAMAVLTETAERAALLSPDGSSYFKDQIAAGTFTKEGFCDDASDAVTYAAQKLDIVASRQFAIGKHFMTSFSDPLEHPAETDLIACLTWGQFSPAPAVKTLHPFVGLRREISQIIDSVRYRECYAAQSVVVAQTAFRLDSTADTGRDWLVTTPRQQSTGRVVRGQITDTEPVTGCWESELVSPLLSVEDEHDLIDVLEESGIYTPAGVIKLR